MRRRFLNRRLRISAFFVVSFWLVLVGRVGMLQLVEAEFRDTANSQRTTSVKLPASAGRILDRRGRPLAVSIRVPSIYADPSRIDDPAGFASSVGPVLGIDPSKLSKKLKANADQRFRWLRRRVDESVVAELDELELPRRSWGIREELRRVYPQGPVAAHILGLRGLDDDARGGLEEQFVDELTGQPGKRRLVTDSLGRPLSLLSEVSVAPLHGAYITLTLDARLSTAVGLHLDSAMSERKPAWVAAIVMNPQTGELLAVESRPTYDPNNPVGIQDAAFHHAFRATFEPGSTVKPLIVAAALNSGVVDADSVIDCGHGRDHVAGRPMKDAVPLGPQPLAQVLARSSNIGSARVAEMLGPDRLYRAFTDFGFGRAVPTNFNTPVAGTLKDPFEWSGYSLGSLSIGHELAVTPLQLITAYASMIQGRKVVPRLIQESGSLVEHAPQTIRPEVSRWLLVEALATAVEHGTVKSMQIDGVRVFGKTGTAQKFDPERGEYRTDRATCLVVGGAPAENPTRLVVVVVDDPSEGAPFSGGRVAGPIAREILADALRFDNDD